MCSKADLTSYELRLKTGPASLMGTGSSVTLTDLNYEFNVSKELGSNIFPRNCGDFDGSQNWTEQMIFFSTESTRPESLRSGTNLLHLNRVLNQKSEE